LYRYQNLSQYLVPGEFAASHPPGNCTTRATRCVESRPGFLSLAHSAGKFAFAQVSPHKGRLEDPQSEGGFCSPTSRGGWVDAPSSCRLDMPELPGANDVLPGIQPRRPLPPSPPRSVHPGPAEYREAAMAFGLLASLGESDPHHEGPSSTLESPRRKSGPHPYFARAVPETSRADVGGREKGFSDGTREEAAREKASASPDYS